jgi:hypothetical protein
MGIAGIRTKATTEAKHRALIFMLASYRWIAGRTLLLIFLAGTFAYAKSTEVQQQTPKRSRYNMTVLTISSHELGQFYSWKKNYGLTDFVSGRADNKLFDIFCSAVDIEWLRPRQDSSTAGLQRLRGLGSKPATSPGRYRLRPC